ncbi:MAG: PIG-L family deacetylase [Thermomicrobiales bacterium]|nr:PIG-L family deacetylase [Thermomicrobiales bacterium]
MSERLPWDGHDRYLLVVAHPDDAEFSSGGTIARLVKAGREVTIVQVTSGDKGTPRRDLTTQELVALREKEEEEAARRLGVKTVEFLHKTDGEVEPNLELRGEIVRMIRRHKPNVLITHDPFRAYAFHPDHRGVGLAAHDAVYPSARDPLFFPEHLEEGLEPHKVNEIWYFNAEHPDLFVDITGTWDDKVDSLCAHVSQIGDGVEVFPRVRERCAEMAKDVDFELAEAFKTVVMRM